MKNFKIFQKVLIIALAFAAKLPLMADKNVDKEECSSGTIMAPPPPCGLPISITKEMRVDFGAVGDGITDDSKAFKRASDWINANWSASSSIKIIVPAGTYLVGYQVRKGEIWNYGTGSINNPSQSYLGVPVFNLTNASNVIIEGAPNMASRIIYKNGLMYGGYRTDTESPCTAYGACNNCPGGADVATVGPFLFLTKCSCITVSNFWVEGRYNMCKRQGMVGECASIQLQYDGILLAGSDNVTISDITCTNFGRDGLMSYYTAGTNCSDLTLTNFISSGNGRQGFSLVSGINVTATNCDFILTGNIKDGAIYSGNPGAGLDIEPDQGGTVSNCSFTNCRFSRNQSVGMISDNYFPSGLTFDNCFFSSLHGTALWPNRLVNSTIKNSVIVGRVFKVGGSGPSDHLLFDNNLFTDWFGSWDAPNTTWAKPGVNPGYLLNLGGPGVNNFVTFKNNTIEVHHGLFLYFDVGVPTSSRIWDSNTFRVNSNDLANSTMGYPACFVSNGFLGHFKCCTLNSNQFTDATPSNSPTSGKYWIGVKFANWGPHSSDNVSNGANYWGPYGPSLYTYFKYNNNWGGGYPFLTGFW